MVYGGTSRACSVQGAIVVLEQQLDIIDATGNIIDFLFTE
jgi:RAB protein geranylgeranyltransferase component A